MVKAIIGDQSRRPLKTAKRALPEVGSHIAAPQLLLANDVLEELFEIVSSVEESSSRARNGIIDYSKKSERHISPRNVHHYRSLLDACLRARDVPDEIVQDVIGKIDLLIDHEITRHHARTSKITPKSQSLGDAKITAHRASDFPGARKLGRPFREAVELFIECKYTAGKYDELTLVEIQQDFPKLREAINTYKRRFGCSPFGIRSVRDTAAARVGRVIENGLDNATRLDRHAAVKMMRRKRTALGLD